MAKPTHYKLGSKATIFVYAALELKILPGQKVEITKEARKHTYVAQAIASGHIVPADEGDDKALKEVKKDDLTEKTKEFNVTKATKAELIDKLLTLDGIEEDEDELNKRNKTELINIYNDLTEEDEDDEDEDEDE